MIVMLSLLVGCGAPDVRDTPTPEEPAPPAADTPPPSGTLAFLHDHGGRQRLRLVDPATGAVRDLLPDEPAVLYPAAPDPRGGGLVVIATVDDPEGHREQLRLVTLSGEQTPLTPWAERVRAPAWTADGEALVFASSAASFSDLYRVARDGRGLTRLTTTEAGRFEPAPHPSRPWLAMGASLEGYAQLVRTDLDGARPLVLTHTKADDVRPRWRPDGAQLAFLSHREGPTRVWLCGPDGDEAHPLRPLDGVVDLDHVWSPAGDRLALHVARGAQHDVRILTPEGEALGAVDGPDRAEWPAWSPDGRWLVVTSDRAGTPDLWLADARGRPVRALTDLDGAEWLARWVPE